MKKLLVLLVLVAVGFVGAGRLLADAPHAHMVNDPGFNQYVDPEVLEHALRSGDASQIIDVAIQMFRGEKAMHRPHAGGSADDLFRRAWMVATQNGDQASLDRISSFYSVENRADFIDQLKASASGGIGSGATGGGGIGSGATGGGGIGSGATGGGGIGGGAAPMDPLPEFSTEGLSIFERRTVNSFVERSKDAYVSLNQTEITQLRGSLHSRSLNLPPYIKQRLENYLNQVNDLITKRLARNSVQGSGNPGGVIGWGNQPGPAPAPRQSGPNGWGTNGPDFNNGPVPAPTDSGNFYHCDSLRADFKHASDGAIVTRIFPNSPLRGRLVEGDKIIALDNISVRSTWELENHSRWTKVDFMSENRGHQTTTIFIR